MNIAEVIMQRTMSIDTVIAVTRAWETIKQDFKDSYVLDSFTSELRQRAWTDEWGFSFTLRDHPCSRVDAVNRRLAVDRLVGAIVASSTAYKGKITPRVSIDVVPVEGEGKNERCRAVVTVITDIYSIAD